MSTTSEVRITTLGWAGYDDPRLPISSYIAQGGTSGDGTGGTMAIRVTYHPAGPQAHGLMYNIEQLSGHTGQNNSTQVQLLTENLGHITPTRPLTATAVGVQYIPRGSLATMDTSSIKLPWWLGAPNLLGGRSSVDFATLNTDADSINVVVYGYIWGPRSTLAPGGPQRPPGAVFGD